MIPLYTSLNEAILELCGVPSEDIKVQSIGGGSISRSYKLEFPHKRPLFLKKNSAALLDMFQAEAEGLKELQTEDGPGVPVPLACILEGNTSSLILPFLEEGKRITDFWPDFGRKLARMHQNHHASAYGWNRNNYIGSTAQSNRKNPSWLTFFKEERLLFQGKLALNHSHMTSGQFSDLEKLCLRLDSLLPEPHAPELLHGDLWSGNYLCGPDGMAWIIDPAVYYGSGEADLAMTEMFGAFPSAFYDAYGEEKPLIPGYSERRDLYNLYHYLNHLNLFGNSYLGAVLSIIQRYS